jgi:lysophospholipase L1-like esterase
VTPNRVRPAALARSTPRWSWVLAVAALVTALPVPVLTAAVAPPARAEAGRLGQPALVIADWPGVVTGLGDSVSAGNACGCTTFVSLVGQALAGGDARAARVHNLSRGGASTWSVLTQLTDPAVRRTIGGASVVLVDVGANDFAEAPLTDPACRPQAALSCYRPALASQVPRLDRILRQIVALARPGGGIVLVSGYWNIFRDGAVGRARGSDYVIGSDALTRAFNASVKAAAQRDGAVYVDTYTPFKGRGQVDCTPLLAPDGDHPNARGHQVLAAAVLAALGTAVRKPQTAGPANDASR